MLCTRFAIVAGSVPDEMVSSGLHHTVFIGAELSLTNSTGLGPASRRVWRRSRRCSARQLREV
jgi:hypothetical protein